MRPMAPSSPSTLNSEKLPFRRGIELQHLRNARSAPGRQAKRRPCRPLPQTSRSRCCVSAGLGGAAEQVAAQLADILEQRAVPAPTTSSQKRLAENFSRITTAPPPTSTLPTATMPPTL